MTGKTEKMTGKAEKTAEEMVVKNQRVVENKTGNALTNGLMRILINFLVNLRTMMSAGVNSLWRTHPVKMMLAGRAL
jgi:hypothetical protein